MKRTFIAGGLLLSLAFLTAPAEAQTMTGAVNGRVVDSEGKPVPQATVLVEYQGEMISTYEVETNDKGRFTKMGLRPGTYLFTVSKEGYQSAHLERRVKLGDRTRLPDIAIRSRAEIAKEQGAKLNKKFAKAVELAGSEQFDEAEVLFKELLEEAPTVPEIHLNLAYVYVQQKDWANAEASYLKTLELRPGDSHATTGLSGVYTETGRDDEAQELVNRAVQENPGNASAQFNLGVFLMNNDKPAEAIPAFEAALAADDTLAEAHFQLGTLLIGEGKVPEALQHLETYLSMNPTVEQNVETANKLVAALKQ
jgi:tetratricopeptide (TPR) repeat protein